VKYGKGFTGLDFWVSRHQQGSLIAQDITPEAVEMVRKVGLEKKLLKLD